MSYHSQIMILAYEEMYFGSGLKKFLAHCSIHTTNIQSIQCFHALVDQLHRYNVGK